MAVGIYRPHLQWYVPQYFFDLYPEDIITVKIKRTVLLQELINMGGSRRSTCLKTNRVKEAIQGYLACVSYADYELGRLMEALDQYGEGVRLFRHKPERKKEVNRQLRIIRSAC